MSAVTVAAGVITVTASIAGVPTASSNIIFTPATGPSGITWTCNSSAAGTLDNQYRPSNCKS